MRVKKKRPVDPNPVPVEWVDDLRRGSRTRTATWLLHALTLLVFLGAPYLRGLWRTRSMQRSFGAAASCLLGTTPSKDSSSQGIDDPAGHFAATWSTPPPGWPARCREPLEELAEDPAWVLFPSVKSAEANVQKAAQILLEELDQLPATSDATQKVAIRPLWALQMLRDAIREHAVATDDLGPDELLPHAAAQDHDPSPTPSVLPLNAAPSASVEIWGNDEELQVAAFDAKGVSYIKSNSRSQTRARLPRSAGLRGKISNGAGHYLVWTTTPEECGVGHCAGKSMGLAPMTEPLTQVPEPRWIAAHPFGSPSRSVAFAQDLFWMAAAEPSGTVSLVEFTFLQGFDPHESDQLPPIHTRPKPLQHAQDMVVYESFGELLALAVQRDAGTLRLVRHSDAGTKTLATLPQSWTSSWIRRCSSPQSRANGTEFFVVGSGAAAIAGFVRHGQPTLWSPLSDAPRPPSRLDTAAQRRATLLCDSPDRVSLVFIHGDGVLTNVTCRTSEAACQPHELATGVEGFAALGTDDGSLVAMWHGRDSPRVRTVRCDETGAPRADPSTPAACWERWGGLCGVPTLARLGSRVVLAAPSDLDLMAVESPDDGRTWSALRSTHLLQPPGPEVLPARSRR